MRLTPVRRAPDGARLARDVDTGQPGGIPLLRAGVPLTDRFRGRLEDVGVHAVWVEDHLSEGIAPVEILRPETRHKASEGVVSALGDAGRAISANRSVSVETLDELSQVADLIAGEVENAPEVALALEDLAAGDAYTHRHSVNVCAIGLLVGRRLMRRHGWVDGTGRQRFDRIEHRLRMLGIGLLLHDIGKLAIPADVLNKPGRLDEAERALINTHPEAGLALLPEDFSPLVKAIVRDHHERWDGSGYPRGRSGEDTSQLARIAAVADVYDAITSERVYAPAKPPHVGVAAIAGGRATEFDPDVVDMFREVVFPYPPGAELSLPDGRLAVVADVHPERPDAPTVRIPTGDTTWDEIEVSLVPGDGPDAGGVERDDRSPLLLAA